MIQLADQYVLDLERGSREKDATIKKLQARIEVLEDAIEGPVFNVVHIVSKDSTFEEAIKGPVF